jgi:hypothetical protein
LPDLQSKGLSMSAEEVIDKSYTVDEMSQEIQERVRFSHMMTVVKHLHEGKVLTLPSGHRIGMAEDYSIGFVLTDCKTGNESIGVLSFIDLKDLRKIMDKYDIMAIP